MKENNDSSVFFLNYASLIMSKTERNYLNHTGNFPEDGGEKQKHVVYKYVNVM
jgi:hypothetical protein